MPAQNITPQPETATLFNRVPPKSAIYVAALVERVGGFVVTYQNARIGATLPAPKDKTAVLSYDAAKKIFDKLVAEKMRGGYRPDEAATASAEVAAAAADLAGRETGVLPQLLNECDEAEAERLLGDDGWGAEEKFDGKRMMLRFEGGGLVAVNRRGLACGVSAAFVADALALGARSGDYLIDGEAVGDAFHAFDLLSLGGRDLRALPFITRRAALTGLCGEGFAHLRVSALAVTAAGKRGLYERLAREGREGVVFKRLGATYAAGRPGRGGDQLKRKFCATATFLVAARNDRRRSVALELLDGAGVGVAVGNVTIPANHAVPEAGGRVEVKYLYAFRGGSVFQPVYLGERDDIGRDECVVSQLKFKGEGETERLAA